MHSLNSKNKVMNKEELFKKISSIEETIISIWGYDKISNAQEELLTALSGLLDIKVEIESYYKFVADGV